jgi:hypothetical protein
MNTPILDRRRWLQLLGMASTSLPSLLAAPQSFTFPGKRPMIVHNEFPEDLETPADAFTTWVTPNDAFFVRQHLPRPKVSPDDHKIEISGMVSNLNRRSDLKPAVFVAEFNHQRERDNLTRLVTVVDRPDMNPSGVPGSERQPQFLSENIASLSKTLAAVSSEKIVVRDAGDKVLQTVTYQWAQ